MRSHLDSKKIKQYKPALVLIGGSGNFEQRNYYPNADR